ncbi:hypothetical protein BpHYR1_002481 [Brachionus plicatilis]|uniref:Uncharacterized protein n=1 Tax=Brachionus plicatilis TaxID=10195 RepID=A0A3M7QGQ5_BRAPC|nr:hypothetical protein BpHYR1_002481 [Brachionus plicatilis]
MSHESSPSSDFFFQNLNFEFYFRKSQLILFWYSWKNHSRVFKKINLYEKRLPYKNGFLYSKTTHLCYLSPDLKYCVKLLPNSTQLVRVLFLVSSKEIFNKIFLRWYRVIKMLSNVEERD